MALLVHAFVILLSSKLYFFIYHYEICDCDIIIIVLRKSCQLEGLHLRIGSIALIIIAKHHDVTHYVRTNFTA
jgi:hypothetical protein